jgi:hypothetical protein
MDLEKLIQKSRNNELLIKSHDKLVTTKNQDLIYQ